MLVHLVSGFLGSGKTTAIATACRLLMQKGNSIGVITNDQGIKLVDTSYFTSNAIANRQVTDGCFCCNYTALDEIIQSLINISNPDVIFAESVGSCTDLVATVMKPLQQFHPNINVSVSVFADVRLLHMLFVEGKKLFADAVQYIYQKQLEEAAIVVITKIDLAEEEIIAAVKTFFKKNYPGKTLVFIDGTNNEFTELWLKQLQLNSVTPPSLQINYDVYAEGEAKLAWLDEEIELYSSDSKAELAAIILCQRIYQKIQTEQLPIGHLKFMLNHAFKISYTAASKPILPTTHQNSAIAKLLINARVQTAPENLQQIVGRAIAEIELEMNCKVLVISEAVFQPGYPRPVYRVV
jgi:G3E family GTPase